MMDWLYCVWPQQCLLSIETFFTQKVIWAGNRRFMCFCVCFFIKRRQNCELYIVLFFFKQYFIPEGFPFGHSGRKILLVLGALEKYSWSYLTNTASGEIHENHPEILSEFLSSDFIFDFFQNLFFEFFVRFFFANFSAFSPVVLTSADLR